MNDQPYQTPSVEVVTSGLNGREAAGKKFAVAGLLLCLGPVAGRVLSYCAPYILDKSALGPALGINSFQQYSDAVLLITAITSFVSGLLGTIGIVLVSLALVWKRNRERWFYLSIVSLILILFLTLTPMSLVFGIIMLFVFYPRRGEFAEKPNG